MAIEKIDPNLCSGCRKCERICPADVIRIDEDSMKACVKYAEDCVTCLWCMSECSTKAITMSVTSASPVITSWG